MSRSLTGQWGDSPKRSLSFFFFKMCCGCPLQKVRSDLPGRHRRPPLQLSQPASSACAVYSVVGMTFLIWPLCCTLMVTPGYFQVFSQKPGSPHLRSEPAKSKGRLPGFLSSRTQPGTTALSLYEWFFLFLSLILKIYLSISGTHTIMKSE